MTYTRTWRNFRRMQNSALLFACLVYLGAVIHAWRVLPGPDQRKALFTIGFPGLFLGLSLLAFMAFAPGRRWVERYVWMSFQAGFGQTVRSVIVGLGVLVFAAGFIYQQVAGVAHGGRYPAGVFSGYAAGIGVIFAQAVLTRELERRPDVRRAIVVADSDPRA
jgi:hypothetical protein